MWEIAKFQEEIKSEKFFTTNMLSPKFVSEWGHVHNVHLKEKKYWIIN